MEHLAPAKSLVQMTYEAILDEICTGALAPGTRLAQDDIARQLGVSRQPVNSAIAMLRAQNFVRDTGRRGVVVAPVDKALFDAIYQFRSAVEPLAVGLAADNMDNIGVASGRRIIARGKAGVAADDAEAVLEADMEFHSLIYRLSGNPIIAESMRLNWRHLQRSMGKVLQYPGMSETVWAEHTEIFETLVAGRGADAAVLMGAHIRNAPIRIAGQQQA
jgi:DNA-binding GntR family transcriptional regulator